jgi:hypothetical protein
MATISQCHIVWAGKLLQQPMGPMQRGYQSVLDISGCSAMEKAQEESP